MENICKFLHGINRLFKIMNYTTACKTSIYSKPVCGFCAIKVARAIVNVKCSPQIQILLNSPNTHTHTSLTLLTLVLSNSSNGKWLVLISL